MGLEIQIDIILPPCSQDHISNGLRELTKILCNGEGGGFGLGGEFGYGVNFENDTFLMHRYCWCEEEGVCPWCTGCGFYEDACAACSNTEENLGDTRKVKGCDYQMGTGIFARFYPYVHGEKGYWDPPNFWHKPSNTRISWYKYIGRGMQTYPSKITEKQWGEVLASCVASMPVAVRDPISNPQPGDRWMADGKERIVCGNPLPSILSDDGSCIWWKFSHEGGSTRGEIKSRFQAWASGAEFLGGAQ